MTLVTHTPLPIRRLVDRYKDLAQANYNDMCALMTYFLFGCESMSELGRVFPVSRSVSSLSRALDKIPTNRLMRRMRASIIRKYGSQFSEADFVWAIDDTANPKYGKGGHRCGVWGGSGGLWHGQKVVVLALVNINDGFAIPVSYRIAPKKDDKNYRSGIEIAADLLAEVRKEGLPELPVVADSWFDSKELMSAIQELGMHFVVQLKSNRNVRSNPGRHVPWVKLADIFKGATRYRIRTRLDSLKVKSRKKKSKVAAQMRLWISERSKSLNVIAVYNRRNGKVAYGYYASTDHSMSRATIWEISRARWKIEVMFRDLKQNLSFGKVPSGRKSAADLSVCLPMLILVSMRLRPDTIWDQEPARTTGDMVDYAREVELNRSINSLVWRQGDKKIARIRARRNLDRLNKKPLNTYLAEAS